MGIGAFRHQDDRGEGEGPVDPVAQLDGEAGALGQLLAEPGRHVEAGGGVLAQTPSTPPG
jgi:hypothetical protein